MAETLVVFDLEFTSWAGALEADWSGPGQFREIVQIGALKVRRKDLAIVDRLELLVRPIMNPELSAYFIALSGITQTALDRDAVDPAAAIGKLLTFAQRQPLLSYGNDMVILGENVGWARARGEVIATEYLSARFYNIRPWLNDCEPRTREANCGRLWDALGLDRPGEGNEHSALFDCFSLVAALRYVRSKYGELPEMII